MTDALYPPAPTRPDEIELMLTVFATVIEGRNATYVSSPFTTGSLAAEWIARNGRYQEDADVSADFKIDVMMANKRQAGTFVRVLREQQSHLTVISPTALPDLPGWTQADYRFFWGRVIEEYANRVVFLDGWESSGGCSYEYLVAVTSGAATFDQRLQSLPGETALEKLHAAASHESLSTTAAFLKAVEAALRELEGDRRTQS